MPSTSITVGVVAAALENLAQAAGHGPLQKHAAALKLEPEMKIIRDARGLLGVGPGSLTPLPAMVSTVTLAEGPGRPHYWLPGPVGEPAYPIATLNNSTWQQALQAVLDTLAAALAEGHVEATDLLTLLERWTGRVPALGPIAQEGVSFYDQTRITAAVANCLHGARGQAEPFLLVGGDLSGVQRFVYTINPHGALRTLRARSLFLELLAEHAVTELLGDLDRSHVVYNGGARFYLLLPNTPATRHRITQVYQDLNEWLLHKHRGTLALSLAYIPFKREDWRQNAGQLWQQVGERLAAAKGRKFAPQLQRAGASFWAARQSHDTCGVCHRDDPDLQPLPRFQDDLEPVPGCPVCHEFYHFGGELPVEGSATVPAGGSEAGRSIRFLARVPAAHPRDSKESAVTIGACRYVLFKRFEEARKQAGNGPVYSLGGWHPGAIPIPYCGYAAHEGQLQVMVKRALGEPLAAVLRMDVDNLGQIFAAGLPGERREFAHVAALSRELALFFKVNLCHLLSAEASFRASARPAHPRRVVVVYAGGDDLFITGAWDDTAELAFDIHRHFSRYTGNNPSLHLSGGLAIGHPEIPVSTLADLAGQAEKKAKDAKPGPNGSLRWRHLKNRMVFFYQGGDAQVISWPDAEHIAETVLKPLLCQLGTVEESQETEAAFVRLHIRRSLLHRLSGLVAEWRRDGRLVHPRLAYALKVATESLNKAPEAVRTAWKKISQEFYSATALREMGFALTWADLATRRKGGQ